MAVFTRITPDDAQRVVDAYGLGTLEALVPIQAGTVNTNHFIDSSSGRHFLRVYEQQQGEGVAYEWALLTHLKARGLPVAAPLPGVEPGSLRIDGKPVAVFDMLSGTSLCQQRVTTAALSTLGETLAQAHAACQDFDRRHESRFGLADVKALLARTGAAGRPELAGHLQRLETLAAELSSLDLGRLPQGVIHGDLFRDNVLWGDAGELSGLLDWESASDGAWLFDVAVTLLAWCCGDTLDWDLAAAFVAGYQRRRVLEDREWAALRDVLRFGCLRFATTRLIDVYLPGHSPPDYKPYTRFLERLDRIEAMTGDELADRLGR